MYLEIMKKYIQIRNGRICIMKKEKGKPVQYDHPYQNPTYYLLSDLLTKIYNSEVPIFPLFCPVCDSPRMTVVIGYATKIECLDCHSVFSLVKYEKKWSMK